MTLFIIVFILAGVVLVGGIVGLGLVLMAGAKKRNDARMAALAAYAQQRGWRHTPSPQSLGVTFRGKPFNGARRPEYHNLIEGTYGSWPFIAFDFSVEDPRDDIDDVRTRTNHAIVAMHLGTQVPYLELQSQSSIGRFFERLMGSEITIGQPEFDDAYYVDGDSPQFARDLLTPQLCALLLQLRDRGWRFEGQSLLVFRRDSLSPALVEDTLASMRAVLNEVPTPVWEKLHGGG